ncbi:MAG: hypothetical protein ABIP95_16500 [Pelobium sp.]
MNDIINRGWIDLVLTPQRFNEVKRIKDTWEAKNYYKECVSRLDHLKEWKTPIYYDNLKLLKHYDCYGFETDRNLLEGDLIEANFDFNIEGKNSLRLKVSSYQKTIESDGLEEETKLLLSEIDANRFNPLIMPIKFGECVISLKRLVNTISIDIKVNPPYYGENVAHQSLIQHFEWQTLTKNIIQQF